MILSYLIIALSTLFAPLAFGRPASAPSPKVYHLSASAEPNALLGRHYLVHDHREAPYIRSTSPRPQQTPRHMKPFARYFADRSGDIWIHERPRARVPALVPRAAAEDEARRKYVDYVSHVGPFAYEPPPPPPPPTVTVTVTPQPSSTLAALDVSSSTVSPEATLSVMNLAAANATVTSTSTSASSPTGTMEPGKGKKVRAKARQKVHKSGKEYKERRKYGRGDAGLIGALDEAA